MKNIAMEEKIAVLKMLALSKIMCVRLLRLIFAEEKRFNKILF